MKINIVSRDKRYYYLNELLKMDGYDTKICDINELESPEIIILSVRKEHTDSELEEIFSRASESTLILTPNSIENPSCIVLDYTKNEAFLKKNAYLTAEGTICLYYNEIKETLQGKSVLVLGYGRIGKYLSKMLKNQGAIVLVYARRKEIKAEIELDGFTSIELDKIPANIDTIFNTVPEEIFKNETNAHKIELASKSGFKYKENVINGAGLPGKMFPKTAAKYIYDEIKTILTIQERT